MTTANRSKTTGSIFVEEEHNLTEGIKNEAVKKPPWLPKRYVIIFLLFFGMVNLSMMTINLSIAIVEMTSNKTVVVNNQTIVQKPEFDWDSQTKGIVLSLYFYGYVPVMPIGGYISTKFGGVSTFGVGVFGTAIFTILSPINYYLNFYWFAFCRIMEGSFEALCYTSVADICSRWTKPEERSTAVCLVLSAVNFAAFVAFPLCGYIARNLGWPAIFYVTGSLSLVWFCFWIMLASNDPSADDSDRKFLARSWRYHPNQKPYPWKNMLTSRPVWVLLFVKFSHGWGLNFLMQCFPSFIKDATHAEIDRVGYLSAIPNSVAILSLPLSGYLMDLIINRGILTPTHKNFLEVINWQTCSLLHSLKLLHFQLRRRRRVIEYTHKLIMCLGSFISACFLMSVTYINHLYTNIIIFVLYNVTLSFLCIIKYLVPIYLSPEYASGITGITSIGFSMGNILSPTTFGLVVTNHSMTQWNRFFTISAAVFATNSIIFALFSSSELQPWSDTNPRPENQQFQLID